MERSAEIEPTTSTTAGVLAAILCVAAVWHAVNIAQAPPLQSANDRSRWCTVWSLLERGTFRIDEIRQQSGWDTIDLVKVDGHFYSTKPPLMAVWVAGVTWGVERVTGWSLLEHPQAVTAATLLMVNWLPFLIGLVMVARRLVRTEIPVATAALVLLLAAFGTLWSPFLASLNNHTVAATGALFGGLCWLDAQERRSLGRFAAWGFAAGWMTVHDLPAGLIAAAFFLRAWQVARWRSVLVFLPAAALPVIALVAVNWIAFGTWKPAYSGYGGETYRFIHEGVPSYWLQPQGVDRNLDGTWAYFLHATFGHHGFFSLTPLWLVGFWQASVRKFDPVSRLRLWTLAITAGLFAFYLSRTENYNYGGVNCGLRWALVVTPLWTLSLVDALQRWEQRWSSLVTVLVLFAASAYSAFDPGGRPWQQPWPFRLAEQQGWIEYREAPPELPHTLYTWFGSVPEPTPTELHPWSEWQLSGTQSRLRLTHAGRQTIEGREHEVITVTQTDPDGKSIPPSTLYLDRERFRAGCPPTECLSWPTDAHPKANPRRDLQFVLGIPLLKAYAPGYRRYLKTPLRVDAFECQRAAVQVETAASTTAPRMRYRVDLWLCEETPFGVIRRDLTVSDPVTGAPLLVESWLLTSCSPAVAANSPLTVEQIEARQRPAE